MANLVKFSRGSATAYNKLKAAGTLDKSTLYFIYDKNNSEQNGLLYLGDVLIGGTGTAQTTISLANITDIDLGSEALKDGIILQYNITTSKWEPVSIKETIETSKAILPTEVVVGNKENEETLDTEVLDRLLPQPHKGAVAIVDGASYIYDGSTWQSLSGGSSASDIETLVEEKINNAVGNLQALTYTITSKVEDIDKTKGGVVHLVPVDGAIEGTNDIYNEYLVTSNGQIERIGNTGVVNLDGYAKTADIEKVYVKTTDMSKTLSNYVPKTMFNNVVGTIADLYTPEGQSSTNLVMAINDLNTRLTWTELSD